MTKKLLIAAVAVMTLAALIVGLCLAFGGEKEDENKGGSISVTGSAVIPALSYDSHLCYAAHGIGDEEIFANDALNADKLNKNFADHLPIFKFDTLTDFETFKNTVIGGFNTSVGHNDVPSLDSVTENYDDEFFESNTLFIIHIPATSGSIRHTVSDINIDDGVFSAEITADSPNAVTMDLVSWFVTVAVDDKTVGTCTQFDAIIK